MFNDRLRAIRISRGYTLQATADAVGITLRSYQRYESGHIEPPICSLVALADFLNVPVDLLLERDDYLSSIGVTIDGINLTPPPRRS